MLPSLQAGPTLLAVVPAALCLGKQQNHSVYWFFFPGVLPFFSPNPTLIWDSTMSLHHRVSLSFVEAGRTTNTVRGLPRQPRQEKLQILFRKQLNGRQLMRWSSGGEGCKSKSDHANKHALNHDCQSFAQILCRDTCYLSSPLPIPSPQINNSMHSNYCTPHFYSVSCGSSTANFDWMR